MKNNTHSTQDFESTYALIVRSEEKERSLFEGAVYFALVVSALVSIWTAVQQPVTFADNQAPQAAKTVYHA
ncbi:MAG TPA: hypothetical protein VM940_06435 [Chthoniobacterales bacterium]|nr:hypothetical protein [Chthoniobacterales bacterium]